MLAQFGLSAPHIDPHTHQNPIFHSFFRTTFSNSIPLHPPHPRITKYFLNAHTINFPPLFPTCQTSLSHFQPTSHLPPSVQIFTIQFSTSTPTSPPKIAPFSLQTLNRFCHLLHQPLKNCAPKALFHDIFHQNQPTRPPAATIDPQPDLPPENRQCPPHRKCYPPPPKDR